MNENQAKRRAWRIGQTKVLHVYRLAVQDGIDAWISSVGQRKLEYSEGLNKLKPL
jgi:SNF2 family DNA or RNA helicase